MEGGQVLAGAAAHLDALLGRLLDVAPPQLIHALEELVLGLLGAVVVAQRQLEVEHGLPGGEAVAALVGVPAAVDELVDDAGADEGGLVRRHVREAGDGLVGDGGLDGVRPPAPVHQRPGRSVPRSALLLLAWATSGARWAAMSRRPQSRTGPSGR